MAFWPNSAVYRGVCRRQELSDVFREVDEDLRRQRFEELWKKYGSWVIGAAVAFVVVVGASLYWNDAQERRQAKLSDEYAAAVELIAEGKDEEGLAALGAIADKAGGGYEAISLLQQAQVLHRQGKIDESVKLYDEVSGKNLGGRLVSELAQVKAAWAIADTASYEDIQARVAEIAEGDGAWRYPAQEILAFSALKNGMTEAARPQYRALLNDRTAPSGVRERSAIMLEVIGPAPRTEDASDTSKGVDAEAHESMAPDVSVGVAVAETEEMAVETEETAVEDPVLESESAAPGIEEDAGEENN